MIVLTIMLISCTSLLIIWYQNKISKFKHLDKLPGPPANWILGNVHEFGSNPYNLFQTCQRVIKTYGKVVRIWQGPFRINLFITDIDLVEYFLSSNVHTHKSSSYNVFKAWLGHGLITAAGNVWKKHRKILTPAFHFNILEQFPQSFHRNAKTLIDILKENSGKTIDTHHLMKNYALDSLCEATMGVNFKSQTNENSRYSMLIDEILDISICRFFSVLNRFDFFFSLTSKSKTFKKLSKEIQDITIDVINMRRKDKKGGNVDLELSDEFGIKKRKVFMDILLEYPGLSDEEIEWQANTFLFAGHDTVGACIAFSLYLLAKNPKVQERLLSEIKEVIGECNDVISLPLLKELNYLDRVLKECMRFYPPVGLFEREVMEDVEIKGLIIPKGTTVSFHPYSQHRDPTYFPNPEVFDPDRFLPENLTKVHPFAYIPFSAGPRNCIGQKYALMNIKSVLVNILRNFELHPADFEHSPILGNDAVLKSKNGLPIKLIYRFQN
ncbi:cytochrome P450 4C1-like [Onthophagus taurus]|uniref:cytochrome P450 4C1-like n=1 Tax=Onthophagus taurus TaxID=166361 RepID=UPI000C2036CB|nr:cytochrome P450 4C1-like [Onthophagus taurus]